MSLKRRKTRSTQYTLAQAPFDDARADLILRSSDEMPVQFHVSKSILSVASAVFADMLSIPPPASQQPHEVQVVDLTEDSETLDLCLRHIYPIQSPNVEDLLQMRKFAEFTRKYQANVLEQYVIRYLTDAIKHDPVGVYFTAINSPIFHLEPPNVQDAPAELYVELLRYHATCGEAASQVAFQRSWFPCRGSNTTSLMSVDPSSICSTCKTPDFIRHGSPSIWSSSPNRFLNYGLTSYFYHGPRCLWSYLKRSAIILSYRPTAEAVTTEDFVLGEIDCVSCSSSTPVYMLGFRELFGTEIKKAVEQVPLPEALRSLS